MFGDIEDPLPAKFKNDHTTSPPPAPTGPQLPPEILRSIQSFLSLPPSPSLSTSPITFLSEHMNNIPPSLLVPFAGITTPRERARVREVKARRMTWARGGRGAVLRDGTVGIGSGSARGARRVEAGRGDGPEDLSANEGWRRWPLLWEKMGGDPLGPSSIPTRSGPVSSTTSTSNSTATNVPSTSTTRTLDEHTWTQTAFPPSRTPHGPGNLPSFLSAQEEEREAADIRAAKQRERRAEREEEERGEEFEDSDEDDEEGEERKTNELDGIEADEFGLDNEIGGVGDESGLEIESRVIRAFEKRLLELFLDGKDTIDYTPIDFPLESPPPDPLVVQDLEDRYFDDQDDDDEVDADADGEERGKNGQAGRGEGGDDGGLGEGEYDY